MKPICATLSIILLCAVSALAADRTAPTEPSKDRQSDKRTLDRRAALQAVRDEMDGIRCHRHPHAALPRSQRPLGADPNPAQRKTGSLSRSGRRWHNQTLRPGQATGQSPTVTCHTPRVVTRGAGSGPPSPPGTHHPAQPGRWIVFAGDGHSAAHPGPGRGGVGGPGWNAGT